MKSRSGGFTPPAVCDPHGRALASRTGSQPVQEFPEHIAARRARVARLNDYDLVALQRNNVATLGGSLDGFEQDWNALTASRQSERETRIATVVLWVAVLAMLALIGAAAIAVGSGALDDEYLPRVNPAGGAR